MDSNHRDRQDAKSPLALALQAINSVNQCLFSLVPPTPLGGFSRICSKLSLPTKSPGVVHTEIFFVALKKNFLSSLVHTTDQGVAGMGALATGRGPLGSGLTDSDEGVTSWGCGAGAGADRGEEMGIWGSMGSPIMGGMGWRPGGRRGSIPGGGKL